MSDLQKNELDHLFREGADMQTFAYNEDAWGALAVRMERKDKRRRLMIWILSAVVLFVIGTGAWYLLSGNNTKEELMVDHAEKISIDKNDNEIVDNQDVAIPLKEEPINKATEISEIDVREEVDAGSSRIQSIVSNTSLGQTDVIRKTTPTAINLSKSIVAQDVIIDKVNTALPSAKTKSTLTPLLTMDLLLPIRKDLSLFSIDERRLRLNKPVVEVYKDLVVEKNHGWSFILSSSPEWSSVDLSDSPMMGWKAGAKIGYQINNHFEITAGLIKCQKKYHGQGSSFNASQSFFVDGIEPMKMEAKCNVYEIPVELYFAHKGFDQSGFIGSLGVSSYMLSSEWYGFEYNPSVDRPDLLKEKTMDNANSHLVGALRISAGYQKRINGHLGIQISPYLQIPITGFGEGRVSLYSAGIQVATRFN